jgi:hypothetical protein
MFVARFLPESFSHGHPLERSTLRRDRDRDGPVACLRLP